MSAAEVSVALLTVEDVTMQPASIQTAKALILLALLHALRRIACVLQARLLRKLELPPRT